MANDKLDKELGRSIGTVVVVVIVIIITMG